ncbi:hypothetical protein Tco_0013447 [Tanacetum coccineum]
MIPGDNDHGGFFEKFDIEFKRGFPDFGCFMVQILWKDKAIPAISIDDLQSSLHKWENSNLLSLVFIDLTSILLARP